MYGTLEAITALSDVWLLQTNNTDTIGIYNINMTIIKVSNFLILKQNKNESKTNILSPYEYNRIPFCVITSYSIYRVHPFFPL